MQKGPLDYPVVDGGVTRDADFPVDSSDMAFFRRRKPRPRIAEGAKAGPCLLEPVRSRNGELSQAFTPRRPRLTKRAPRQIMGYTAKSRAGLVWTTS